MKNKRPNTHLQRSATQGASLAQQKGGFITEDNNLFWKGDKFAASPYPPFNTDDQPSAPRLWRPGLAHD